MLKTIKIKITGMHCHSCAIAIETEIMALKGIEKTSVDQAKNLARVEYEDKIIDSPKIIQAIERLNYQAQEIKSDDMDKTSSDPQSNNLFLLGLLIPVVIAAIIGGEPAPLLALQPSASPVLDQVVWACHVMLNWHLALKQ